MSTSAIVKTTGQFGTSSTLIRMLGRKIHITTALCWPSTEKIMAITKEKREKFLTDYQSRIIERAGWTPEEAKSAADAIDDIDALINENFDGSTAADEEMSCWTNDE